jgi:hypothetical protein
MHSAHIVSNQGIMPLNAAKESLMKGKANKTIKRLT